MTNKFLQIKESTLSRDCNNNPVEGTGITNYEYYGMKYNENYPTAQFLQIQYKNYLFKISLLSNIDIENAISFDRIKERYEYASDFNTASIIVYDENSKTNLTIQDIPKKTLKAIYLECKKVKNDIFLFAKDLENKIKGMNENDIDFIEANINFPKIKTVSC